MLLKLLFLAKLIERRNDMKISWGKGITFVYIIFLIVVLGTVAFTTTVDVDLVTDDYYEKELKYQNEIDKKNRTNQLSEQLEIKLESENVKFNFPKAFTSLELGGKISFYRPSNKNMDFALPVNPDSNGIQLVPSKKFAKGLWKIKTDWNYKNIEYFNEKIIVIN